MSDLHKAIAAMLLSSATMAGCSTGSTKAAPTDPPVRLMITETGPDFVIRHRDDVPAGATGAPAIQIPLGSAVHLDRRLVTRAAGTLSQENSNGPID